MKTGVIWIWKIWFPVLRSAEGATESVSHLCSCDQLQKHCQQQTCKRAPPVMSSACQQSDIILYLSLPWLQISQRANHVCPSLFCAASSLMSHRFVTVRRGSPAARSSQIQPGDQLEAVEGRPVGGLQHRDLAQILRRAGNTLRISITPKHREGSRSTHIYSGPPTSTQAPPTSRHAPPTSNHAPSTSNWAPPTSSQAPPTFNQVPPTSSQPHPYPVSVGVPEQLKGDTLPAVRSNLHQEPEN